MASDIDPTSSASRTSDPASEDTTRFLWGRWTARREDPPRATPGSRRSRRRLGADRSAARSRRPGLTDSPRCRSARGAPRPPRAARRSAGKPGPGATRAHCATRKQRPGSSRRPPVESRNGCRRAAHRRRTAACASTGARRSSVARAAASISSTVVGTISAVAGARCTEWLRADTTAAGRIAASGVRYSRLVARMVEPMAPYFFALRLVSS